MSADAAAVPAPVPDTLDVKNVRDDLGDAVVAKFVEARTMVFKYENKVGEKDADEVVPATEILVQILQTVPQDKTRSAGYAEVLLVYGRVLFAFAKRDILRSSILGGDVEAEVLKSQLQEALLKKEKNTAAAADVPSKNVEKVKAVPTVAEEAEEKDGEPKKDGEKDAEETPEDEKKVDAETKANGDTKMTTEEKANGDAPVDEAKEKESRSEKDTAEGKTEVVEEGKKDSDAEAKLNGDAKSANKSGGNAEIEITAADEDSIMPAAEKKEAAAENAEGGEGEEQDDSNDILTWEQLEYARTIFEQLGAAQKHRLPAVFEALGDLLLETDQSEKAAEEYGKALKVLRENDNTDTGGMRLISNLEYQRYIALRKEQPAVALAALKNAAAEFEKVLTNTDGEKNAEEKKEFQDVLDTMTGEVKAFEAALPPGALSEVAKKEKAAGDKDEDEEVVTIVQPRRRVRKVVEVESEGDAEDEGPVKKKARVAEAEGRGAEADPVAETEKNEKGANGTSVNEATNGAANSNGKSTATAAAGGTE